MFQPLIIPLGFPATSGTVYSVVPCHIQAKQRPQLCHFRNLNNSHLNSKYRSKALPFEQSCQLSALQLSALSNDTKVLAAKEVCHYHLSCK